MIKIKNIRNLVSIFLKDTYQNINIINKDNKINKKSIYIWLIVLLFLTLFFISDKVIRFLISTSQPTIFLNVYFLILAILIIFQTILVCTNIFYFSNDLEFILPLPIKPIELLISKYGTLLCSLYISEILFSLVPILIYGLLTNAPILFYLYMLIVFVMFPIFLSLIVNIIMMFVMKISKFIKNKDIFQIIMTLILMIFIFGIEYKLIGNIIVNSNQMANATKDQVIEKITDFNNRIRESNNYFLVINPCVNILSEAKIQSFIEVVKLFFINCVTFIIFLIIGKITYLKSILKNTTYIIGKKSRKTNLEKKCKSKSIARSYISKEFKSLFKSPMYFMQCIFPMIILLITLIIMTIMILPKITIALQNEEIREKFGDLSFDITAVYIILGIMQILFMMSTVSLTAISREGKSAVFIKYIPVSFYRQFIYKAMPQIFINMIIIITVLGLVVYAIPNIQLIYIAIIFILGMLINIFNSYFTLLIDLLRPKLNWDTEYAVVKQNGNKIFQYALAIIIILFLIYLNSIFKDIDLNSSLIITISIFSVIILIFNIIIRKMQKKLFNKII